MRPADLWAIICSLNITVNEKLLAMSRPPRPLLGPKACYFRDMRPQSRAIRFSSLYVYLLLTPPDSLGWLPAVHGESTA